MTRLLPRPKAALARVLGWGTPLTIPRAAARYSPSLPSRSGTLVRAPGAHPCPGAALIRPGPIRQPRRA